MGQHRKERGEARTARKIRFRALSRFRIFEVLTEVIRTLEQQDEGQEVQQLGYLQPACLQSNTTKARKMSASPEQSSELSGEAGVKENPGTSDTKRRDDVLADIMRDDAEYEDDQEMTDATRAASHPTTSRQPSAISSPVTPPPPPSPPSVDENRTDTKVDEEKKDGSRRKKEGKEKQRTEEESARKTEKVDEKKSDEKKGEEKVKRMLKLSGEGPPTILFGMSQLFSIASNVNKPSETFFFV